VKTQHKKDSLDWFMQWVTVEGGDHWRWRSEPVQNPRGDWHLPRVAFQGRSETARRVAWELVNGEPCSDPFVVVTCGNAWCVNPACMQGVDGPGRRYAKGGGTSKGRPGRYRTRKKYQSKEVSHD